MQAPFRWAHFTAIALLFPACAAAQEAYTVEAVEQTIPASIAKEVAAVLGPRAYRVKDGQGKTFAEIWLRKAVPASAQPSGAKGVIQFPFLAESELLGVVKLAVEGHDFRDQAIAQGAYTARYGLQPINGDHLGVSPFRDYIMLLPPAKDTTLQVLPRKQLEAQSAESAGSSHPAVFFLLSASASSGPVKPSMIHDEEKNTWRVVVPLTLEVKGESKPVEYPISIVLIGASEAA